MARRALATAATAATAAAAAAAAALGMLVVAAPAAASASVPSIWPAHGQAAYVLGGGHLRTSPGQHAVPIASVAKVMTAYLVLRAHPIAAGRSGFVLTIRARDVRDLRRRTARGESVVVVRAGERLTERQALAALLLPSANNVAILLARRVSGTVSAFVRAMNRAARALRMRHTVYTDPSGFDPATRSTAADQLRLAQAALRDRFFRVMVSRRQARIPVVGRVRNRDTLLHHDGFVGVKTGSMSASGGCFVFRSHRIVAGRRVDLVGVVLGQRGGDLVQAGLRAAKRLVDRVAPRRGSNS
ncbi:D-alanyl-D-alanine carboxypeptidase family protein [uncultured Jatrophihabitans sp.]|uniref:D-alanyl-D-alanine carboxypeptidase family protein n=1 Tax=uncultured Jatrophihabitans sp. TaxID=1610747 RepID=UPI0035CA6EA9